MGVKIADMDIAKGWFKSHSEFLAVAKKPGKGAIEGNTESFAKWIVSAMWMLIVCHAVNIGFYATMSCPAGATGCGPVTGVYNFISAALGVYLQTWITWYSFVKRSPACCPFCIFCLEDIKPLNLVVGLLMVVAGAGQVLFFALGLLNMLANINLSVIFYIVFVAVYVLYAVCMIAAGLCLVKLGQKEAGVEIPGADKIGA